MAYELFKPTIWSKKIQHELPKFTVFQQDCDYQFKGEVKQGHTVKILGATRPTIGDYTGVDIGAPEELEGVEQTLVIDQAPYFHFMVDDVDEAQAIDGLMEAYMEEATRAMAERRDSFIAGLAKNATQAGTMALTDANTVKKAIDEGLVKLMENGVKLGRDDVTIYLNPMASMLFTDYILDIKTKNDNVLSTGELGHYMGCKIKMSNNFYNDGTNEFMFIKTKKAIAFAADIDRLEAYRPERRFGDAIKGLNVYGGKIVRDKEIYVMKAAV